LLGVEEINMAKLSARMQRALDSDCADDLNEIILAKRKADFDGLRRLISTEADVEPRYRTLAIYALGRWGNEAVVDDILQVLPDLDDTGMLTAMDSLGRLGSQKALQGVLEHADDPSPQVRKFAIRALGRFELPAARVKLMEINEKDSDQQLRDLARKYIDREQKSG
jgi:HEAT repeat protein